MNNKTNYSKSKMQMVSLKSSVLLSFLFIIGSLSLNAATYQVEIDYHRKGLTYTDSGSPITISFFDHNQQLVHEESVAGIKPIKIQPHTFRLTTNSPIERISLSIGGNDAFFIDRIMIWKDGQKIKEYGKDGGKGWCLSTDPNDTNGGWKNHLEEGCTPSRTFLVESIMDTPGLIGGQPISANNPSRQPIPGEDSWVYYNNEQRSEINAEGIGRCYDVRNIDPLNWSNESLKSGQRASVISLIRDDSKRPARHNNKDYVVPKGVVYTSEIIGDSEAESKFAATSYEYEQEVLQEYRADVGVPKVGSAKVSAAFRDVNQSSGSNSSLFTFSKMYKQFYKLDLYFDDPSHQHYIDPRFWNGVRLLGQEMSAQEFINKFGTHYASTTYYGGNFMQRRAVSQSEYSYYESNQNEFKADVEGTIKKVNFAVGTTQGSRNRRGETESVAMSSAKIFTVGGDLNQYRPDLWAQSVLNNLAVVKVRLTRLSSLLTSENFPEIPNIREKRILLQKYIEAAEREAVANQSPEMKNAFFSKKAATYKLRVTYMKCTGHGAKEPGTESEYFGKIYMGMFKSNGTALKTYTCFNKSDKNTVDLALNQTRDINRTITVKVSPDQIQNGFASVYGHLKEKDLIEFKLSTFSKHSAQSKIYFRSALDHKVTKKITFTSKYGDKVEVHFSLERA